ncbi:MAG: OB-fold nucleic acid binding domain-containing protein, partial [Deltaproteobacteria bacterium]|nr:OB-fold nucleic acid binding domain-containing protein [Deltaproteobacteria bacterium]
MTPPLFRTPIRTLLHSTPVGTRVRAHGWVRTRRDGGGVRFIEINDGSCLANLQVVVEESSPQYPRTEGAATGSSVIVEGELTPSPAKGQRV